MCHAERGGRTVRAGRFHGQSRRPDRRPTAADPADRCPTRDAEPAHRGTVRGVRRGRGAEGRAGRRDRGVDEEGVRGTGALRLPAGHDDGSRGQPLRRPQHLGSEPTLLVRGDVQRGAAVRRADERGLRQRGCHRRRCGVRRAPAADRPRGIGATATTGHHVDGVADGQEGCRRTADRRVHAARRRCQGEVRRARATGGRSPGVAGRREGSCEGCVRRRSG